MSDTNGLAEFRASLQLLFQELDEELKRIGPVCEISGRCCRFKEFDHTLFLSEPEARLLLEDAPSPVRERDGGETCPWQDHAGRCTAREARPLACRLFYCDPAYASAMPELSEEFIGRLKRLIGRHGLPWNYAPLHHHLHQLSGAGGNRSPNEPV